MVLEKTLANSLDSKEIKPVNLKGICIGRTDAEVDAPIFWSPDVNSQLMEKSLILGKIEGRKKRGHHRVRWLNGITDAMDMNLCKLWEMVKDREALACCSTWGRKESDTSW